MFLFVVVFVTVIIIIIISYKHSGFVPGLIKPSKASEILWHCFSMKSAGYRFCDRDAGFSSLFTKYQIEWGDCGKGGNFYKLTHNMHIKLLIEKKKSCFPSKEIYIKKRHQLHIFFIGMS